MNSHSDYAEPTVISDILQLIGCKTKPVHSKLQASAVKLPHEFVRDISRTPTKILPTNFKSASKEKLHQLDLTAEEQETLNRLTSCQNTNVITSWKNKSGIWKGEDSEGSSSENSSPAKPKPWQNVLSITRRGSFPYDRKMLTAPKDVEWKVGHDDDLDDEESRKAKSCTDRLSDGIERDGEKSDRRLSCEGEFEESKDQHLIAVSSGKSKDESEVGNAGILGHGDSGKDGATSDAESLMDHKLHYDYIRRDEDCLEKKELSEPSLSSDGKIHDNCLIFINDVQSDFEQETAALNLDDENTGENNENADLSCSARINVPGRSKSSGDIKGDYLRNFQINVPGRGLFDKMRKNVKFTLPSSALARHRKEKAERSAKASTDKGTDSERPNELSPKQVFRKMSLPGSL